MAVTDVFPPTILRYGMMRLIQDFVSPFLLFLKPQYRLVYAEREALINSSSMKLESACTLDLAGKNLRNWTYILKISDNQLNKLEITTNRSSHVAVFTNPDKA
jgi:transcriptional antiterminator